MSRLYLAVALLAACRINTDLDGAQLACEQSCPDGLTCIDGRCQEPGAADAAADAPVDAEACECTADTFADDCGANLVDIADGERVCASTESNTNQLPGCLPPPLPGNDAAYRVSVTQGQTITATVQPQGFDAAVYIMRDCASSCEAIADDVGQSGTETVVVSNADAGDYFVIVDSPSGSGCYELTVDLD